MKALSLWQPWATLVVVGAKKIETRSWSTQYRGPIIIHSTASVPPPAHEMMRHHEVISAIRTAGHDQSNLPMGCYLGVVDVVHIVSTEHIGKLPWLEGVFGNFESGRFAWYLENPRELNEPIPAGGHRQLWNPPIEVIRQVNEALA